MTDIPVCMESLHTALIDDTTWTTTCTESYCILTYIDPILTCHHDYRIFESLDLSLCRYIYFEVAHHRDTNCTEVVGI
jgi:hypothetical protein